MSQQPPRFPFFAALWNAVRFLVLFPIVTGVALAPAAYFLHERTGSTEAVAGMYASMAVPTVIIVGHILWSRIWGRQGFWTHGIIACGIIPALTAILYAAKSPEFDVAGGDPPDYFKGALGLTAAAGLAGALLIGAPVSWFLGKLFGTNEPEYAGGGHPGESEAERRAREHQDQLLRAQQEQDMQRRFGGGGGPPI